MANVIHMEDVLKELETLFQVILLLNSLNFCLFFKIHVPGTPCRTPTKKNIHDLASCWKLVPGCEQMP